MTGLMETKHFSGTFPNVDKTKYTRQGGLFCDGKMNYAKNVGLNAFMHKYLYNNHDIEVNFESLDDMLCGPPTMTNRESMQFIRIQIKSIIIHFKWW
jgi:hypothetical protein